MGPCVTLVPHGAVCPMPERHACRSMNLSAMLTAAATTALVLLTYALADNMGNPGLLLIVAFATAPTAYASWKGLRAQGLLESDALLATVTGDAKDMSTGASATASPCRLQRL